MMISIVKATKSEVPSALTVINKAYRGEDSGKGWTHELDFLKGDIRIDREQLGELVEEKEGIFFVAKNNDRVIGTMHLQHTPKGLYLGLLSVDPEIQGAGTGKALLNVADKYAFENGFRRIYMIVISERHELINWYVRNGYALTGKKEPFAPPPKFGIPLRQLYVVELEKLTLGISLPVHTRASL